mmetsp:Transcript_25358/g.41312  ORF Transcript_25358/g.41312 Transcript_25358/m.41312 type:complete len:215 (+) Transcript_25358:1051-1695(+)
MQKKLIECPSTRLLVHQHDTNKKYTIHAYQRSYHTHHLFVARLLRLLCSHLRLFSFGGDQLIQNGSLAFCAFVSSESLLGKFQCFLWIARFDQFHDTLLVWCPAHSLLNDRHNELSAWFRVFLSLLVCLEFHLLHGPVHQTRVFMSRRSKSARKTTDFGGWISFSPFQTASNSLILVFQVFVLFLLEEILPEWIVNVLFRLRLFLCHSEKLKLL